MGEDHYQTDEVRERFVYSRSYKLISTLNQASDFHPMYTASAKISLDQCGTLLKVSAVC